MAEKNKTSKVSKNQSATKQNKSSRSENPLHPFSSDKIKKISPDKSGKLQRPESDMEESLSKYSDLYDFAPVGYFTFDRKGLILDVNFTGSEQLETKKNNLMKKPFDRFIHPEDQEVFHSHRQKVLKSKTRQACEVRIKRRDRSEFHAQLVSIALPDSEGKYSNIRMAMINTTKRRQAEQALSESERKFRSIFENANDVIIYVNKWGTIVEINSKVEDIFGYTRDELIGKDFTELGIINTKDLPRVIKSFNDSVAMDEAGDNADRSSYLMDIEVTRRNGDIAFVEASTSAIKSEGKLEGFLTYVHDYTRQRKTENTLREKTAQLNAIIENLPFDVFGIDSQGNYFIQNSSLRKNWGNIIGKKPSDFAPDFNAVNVWEENNRKAFAGETVTGEVAFRMPDGEKKYFYNIITPIHEDRKIWGILGINIDITERKQIEEELLKHRTHLELLVSDKTSELTSAIELLQGEIIERRKTEEALRQSEKRYRELVNYMSSGVAVFESVEKGSDFIFKDFNKSAEKIDQIKKEDLIGRRITDVFPGVKEFGLLEVLQLVWETGESRHFPVSMYRDERISGWRENYVYKLPSGEVVAIYDDVTEQVQAAERESELLRELKNIFDNFPVGIVYLNKNYEIISTNRFFNDFAGFDEGELNGKLCYETVGEFADESDRRGIEKVCTFCKKDECARLKKPTVMERPLKDKFIRVTTIPELNDEGDISRFMEIVEDITERKLAEAEVIRASHLAALGELAAGVAHEINNPINGIINYTQILLNKGIKGSSEHDIAGRIIKESDRIAGIVNNLLSFARDRKEEKTVTNLLDVLSDSLALTETQILKDGIKLIVNVPSSLPATVAQPQQIEQVFLNIISNARYALNEKYPRQNEDKILEIQGRKTTIDDRAHIGITFHDHGSGIPAHILDKVINPFFSTKSTRDGTGLGLSISHGIVSNHGGKLVIDSVEGEYTKVKIELPVVN